MAAPEIIPIDPLDPPIPAKTTTEENLTTAGQRSINLIWETIQGRIALAVILGAMGISGLVLILSMFLSRDLTSAQALVLGFIHSLATGVTSFYFSRTNHSSIGGVGQKPSEGPLSRR